MPKQRQEPILLTYDRAITAPPALVRAGLDTLPAAIVTAGARTTERFMVFSADETSDVGLKRGSPITPDVPAENNAFTGTVQLVVIETDTKEEVDHLISREHLLHILIARQ